MGFIPVFTFLLPVPQTEGAFHSELWGREESGEDGPRPLVSALRKAELHLRAPARSPPTSCAASQTELLEESSFFFPFEILGSGREWEAKPRQPIPPRCW